LLELVQPVIELSVHLDVLAVLDALTPDQFEEWVGQYPAWAPLIAIAFALFVSLTPLPMETIAIVNGMWFGPIVGGVLTWVGALIAAMLAFTIAKLIGFPVVSRLLPEAAFLRMQQAVDDHAPSTLVMVRMIPLIPFTVINYGAGVTTVGWRTFLWTSAVGMAPPTILWVMLGHMMRTQPVAAFAILFGLAVVAFLLVKRLRRWWDASRAVASD
jgi:uncharacterized membrane protein YdjX (TVP38/TMEM64 family)